VALQFTLFEKQGKRHQIFGIGIWWYFVGYFQAILACKWLASNKCCHGHNQFFSKKLNYSANQGN
jgi:hypothetical protein